MTDTIKVQLEVVPDDQRNFDPAELGQVARKVSEALSSEGYTIDPTYTGEKGGALFEIVQQLAHQIQTNKEILVALLSVAAPIVQYLFKVCERRLEESEKGRRSKTEGQPINITVIVDGAPISVDASDADNAAMLVEVFKASHPEVAANATLKSKVRVIAKLPQKESRKRR
jgi:hypothetical protein